MKSVIRVALIVFAFAAFASAAPIVTIFTAVAPNSFGSPSYGTWQANAVQAIVKGLTSGGTVNDPTFFQETSSFTTADEIPTSFPSWLAVANPAAPFQNELGNRVTFISVVHDSSAQINISAGLHIVVNVPIGSDYDSGAPPGTALDAAVGAYTAHTVGVDVDGGNNVLSTAITGTGNVDFIFSFVGFGLPPFTTNDQNGINDDIAAIQAIDPLDQSLTDTTTFGTSGASANRTALIADVASVPEPTSFALLGLGLAGLGLLRRKLIS